MKLIYADFMKIDNDSRLVLTCYGTQKDLNQQGIALKEGMTLVFYNEDEDLLGNRDDLVVKGIVEYDKEKQQFAARIDWNKIKNISELSLQEKHEFGIK